MTAELTPAQEREKKRELALIRLQNDFFRGLAASKVGTWQDYGALLGDIRKRTINGYSEDLAYQELIAPRLERDNSLEDHAATLLKQSLGDIKVSDYYAVLGLSSQPRQDMANKLVSELADDVKNTLVGTYFKNLADTEAAKTLASRVDSRNSLVRMLCEQEQPSRR